MMERLLVSSTSRSKPHHQRVSSEPAYLVGDQHLQQRISWQPPHEQQKQEHRRPQQQQSIYRSRTTTQRARKHSRSATLMTDIMLREDVEEEPLCLSMRVDDNPFCKEGASEFGSIVRVDSPPPSNNNDVVSQEHLLPPGKEVEDVASVVSSISNDSRKRYSNGAEAQVAALAEVPTIGVAVAAAAAVSQVLVPPNTVETRDPPPPQEIDVPLTCTTRIVPEWLLNGDVSNKNSPTKLPSEGPTTPTSTKEAKSQRHASAHRHSRTLSSAGGSRLPRPVLARGTSAPALFREPPALEATVSASSEVAGTPKSADVLIGDRPRRKHARGPSLAFSVGSLVGQSSYVTESTLQSSISPSSVDSLHLIRKTISSSSSNHKHRRAQSCQLQTLQSCHSFATSSSQPSITPHDSSLADQQQQHGMEKPPRTRRRNPVKQEMLYVLGKVTKPVKNLVRSNSGQLRRCDLRRSNGMLT